MLYQIASQSVNNGDAIPMPTNVITSTGDITASGTTGVVLAPGQYLVNFESDASRGNSGIVGVGLALNGTVLPYTVTDLTTNGGEQQRLSTSTIINATGNDTLTVVNNSGSRNNYENSSLTVVKLR